jgi:two-component system, LuxR family, response regulator FixJ
MDLVTTPYRGQVDIVEDDAAVRESLTLLLSTAQIASRTFASAEDYLASVPLDESTCVIIDYKLPGLSGMDLLKRIAAAAGDAAVIVITGHADVPTAVCAMKSGAFHFVEKPLDPEALLLTVKEALARTGEVRERQTQVQEFTSRRALLTDREQEVFALMVEGLPTKLIASRLGITARTTEHHRAAVMHKLRARTSSHLVRMALGASAADPGQGPET